VVLLTRKLGCDSSCIILYQQSTSATDMYLFTCFLQCTQKEHAYIGTYLCLLTQMFEIGYGRSNDTNNRYGPTLYSYTNLKTDNLGN